MRPSRVLHLDAGRTYRGGQRQLFLLAQAQCGGSGPTPFVLSSCPSVVARCRSEGIPARAWAGPWNPLGTAQLHRSLRNHQPQILHAHDARAQAAARLLRRQGPALVIHRRIDDPPGPGRTTRWKYAAGHFICVSDAVRSVLRSYGIAESRMTVVRSGLAIPSSAPGPFRSPPSSSPLPLQAISLGALVPHKGHCDLLEALGRVTRPIDLAIAGGGPLEASLREQAKALLPPIVRIRFLGPKEDPRPLLAQAQLVVHPSRTEGLGTALIDAMACARPVLATRTGGIPEIVDPERTGWLVPPKDPQAMAEALDQLAHSAATNPTVLANRGLEGWRRAQRHFSLKAMVRGVHAVYDSLQCRTLRPTRQTVVSSPASAPAATGAPA